MKEMSLSSLAKPATQLRTFTEKTSTNKVVPAAEISAATQPTSPDSTSRRTKSTFEALKKTGVVTQDFDNNVTQMSLAVLSALDCIIVDGYTENFSLFSTQTQTNLINANIIDPDIMLRENIVVSPLVQFPDTDDVFYELDEGPNVSLQKMNEQVQMTVQKDMSTVVADLMKVNFKTDSNTLKQLSATTLNETMDTPKGIPKKEKTVKNLTKKQVATMSEESTEIKSMTAASAAPVVAKSTVTKTISKTPATSTKARKRTFSRVKKY